MTNEELTSKYVSLDERVTRHTEQIKTCFSQIAETKSLTESMHKMATTIELLVHEQKDINKKVDRLTNEFEEVKEKPAKRWDSIVNLFITAVGSAFLTYIFVQLGLQ